MISPLDELRLCKIQQNIRDAFYSKMPDVSVYHVDIDNENERINVLVANASTFMCFVCDASSDDDEMIFVCDTHNRVVLSFDDVYD